VSVAEQPNNELDVQDAILQKEVPCIDAYRDFCINTDWRIVSSSFQPFRLFYLEEFSNLQLIREVRETTLLG